MPLMEGEGKRARNCTLLERWIVFLSKVAQREFVSLCPPLRSIHSYYLYSTVKSRPWLPSPVISSIHPREESTDNILFFSSLRALLVSPPGEQRWASNVIHGGRCGLLGSSQCWPVCSCFSTLISSCALLSLPVRWT